MGPMMRIVMGVITLVVAFILFPIILTALDTIGSANLTNLTGVSSVYVIMPVVLFAGMLFGGGLLAWTGIKGMGK